VRQFRVAAALVAAWRRRASPGWEEARRFDRHALRLRAVLRTAMRPQGPRLRRGNLRLVCDRHVARDPPSLDSGTRPLAYRSDMADGTDALGLAHHAREWPDKPALIVGETQRTYGELASRVHRLARALRAVGVGVGDTVGAALHNGCEWFELLNAVGVLGAQLVPIGYRLKGPEIAYMRDTIENNVLQPEIKSAIVKKITQLKEAGHTVEAIDFSWNEYVLPTYYILATAEASSNLSRFDGVRYGFRSENTTDPTSLYKKTRSEGFGKEVQRRILLGTFVLSSNYYDAYYSKAQKVRRLIRNEIKGVFEKYDFILMPTTPSTAFKLGEHSDNPVEMYLADLFSVQANVAGIPAISIPCGADKQGLPIGLQLLADDFQERNLLSFSKTVLEMN